MNGRIIVVTHKDYAMPEENIYYPICVGSGIPILSHMFQPDNTGDNISEKNTTYCELTAIYWAWKNLALEEFDYIGVTHYRRHFSLIRRAKTLEKVIKAEEIDRLFEETKKTVFVTAKKRYPISIEDHYIYSLKGYKSIHKKDISRLREAIHFCSPEYDVSADRILRGHSAHMLNMFIMDSRSFASYCEWLFPIIDRVVANSADRDDQRRYAGALSEFCLDIWLNKNKKAVKELQLLETERIPIVIKILRAIKRVIRFF